SRHLDRGRARVACAARDHLRADSQAPAPRALRAALAPGRDRAARALAVALEREHDRRLGGRARLPAGGAVRGRDALHPRRAPALLDGGVEALGPERDPRATARAARGEAPRLRRLRALRAAAVGAALFAVACALPHVGIFRGHIDTSLFQSYGDRTLHGEVPYRDFSLEYPPGALPAFAVPSLGPARDYDTWFSAFDVVAGLACVLF